MTIAGVILILATGYTVGAFLIGTFASNPPQSSAAGIPGAPPGVSYVLAEAQLVSATSVPATGACTASNLGTLTTPTALTNGSSTVICLTTAATGFGFGDTMYVLEVSWGTTAANATIFEAQIGVSVTPAANDIVAASYLKTSATITSAETAIFAIDLTQAGDTSLITFNVLITEL